jgi:hypothetical protein
MAITKEWQAHSQAWQSSGQRQAAYGLQKGLNRKTFTARLSEYRRQQKEAESRLILIVVDEEEKRESAPIVLYCGKSHRLEWPGTVSTE